MAVNSNSAEVQQFLSQIPMAWRQDAELGQYHIELNKVLQYFFREAFWSNTDTTESITSGSTIVAPIHREHIICLNTSAITITLNDGSDRNEPYDDQQVMVTRQGTGAVTVSFGNKTSKGAGTLVLAAQYDSPHFKWSDAADEWLVVA